MWPSHVCGRARVGWSLFRGVFSGEWFFRFVVTLLLLLGVIVVMGLSLVGECGGLSREP